MPDQTQTLRLDAGHPYLWRVGEIALQTVVGVGARGDDIRLEMSLFLDGEHGRGTPLKKTCAVTLEPWSVHLEPGGGVPVEVDRKLERLLEKYRDEVTHRAHRLLRSRNRELWREQDLTGMSSGVLVRYRNLFPADFDLIYVLEDEAHFLEDYYCLVAGCPCATVTMAVTALDDDHGAHRELGPVTLDLDETPTKPEGNPEAVRIVKALLVDSDLRDRLDSRHQQCRRIAPAVAQTLGGSPPAATLRRAKVGRNAPCPCGSGKKYKKCCL